MGGLASRLKTSLDELRMQVLGAQVLLGFQFQSLFQDKFQQASAHAHAAAAIGLMAICLSLAGLIAPAAQHRLVEQGDASVRILKLASRCAEASLALLALALASDVFVAASLQDSSHPIAFAAAAFLVSIAMWFGVGRWRAPTMKPEKLTAQREALDVHAKIEQMLTESRVILPGAQAMLGFQLIVTMTNAFNEMTAGAKDLHFLALGAVIFCVVLLITPAAVHRLRFAGKDDPRFHRIGSSLITAALLPLALGISLDITLAALRLSGNRSEAACAGIGTFILLLGLWYAWPLAQRNAQGKRSQA